MMKKLFGVFTLLFAITLVYTSNVSAESIQDYRNKIASLQKEKENENKKSADVQSQIDSNKAKVTETTNKIEAAKKDQENTRKEIAQLDKDIAAKKEEIKDILVFYQASENDNFYLKFILGADSFEDFIYRFSVAEQLTDANDRLVDEMNALIKKNEKKIQELETKQKELNKLNEDLSKQISKLGSEKKKISENALSIDDEISALNEQIKFYKNLGCGETQSVSSCINPPSVSSAEVVDSEVVRKPSAKGFIIPTPTGYISSYYGGRIHPIYGTASYHDGVDIACNTGTTIMASNSGIVLYAGWYYGFGKAVLVYHSKSNITTLYGHMSSISTSQGAYVKRGQKIGEVGSTGNSTGPHLHFQAMYGSGYGTTFDPMNLVNMPIQW